MNKLTLRGPESSIDLTKTSENVVAFNNFVKWLQTYNDMEPNSEVCDISSKNRFVSCRLKAKRLGLVPIATIEELRHKF